MTERRYQASTRSFQKVRTISVKQFYLRELRARPTDRLCCRWLMSLDPTKSPLQMPVLTPLVSRFLYPPQHEKQHSLAASIPTRTIEVARSVRRRGPAR